MAHQQQHNNNNKYSSSKSRNNYTERFKARFGLSKFAHGGLVLGSSQFSLMPLLPQKTTLI